ncbi:MAG: sigma-70 family RNA polymerase sigma factor [Halieaceae bacterium]|jgi:RNA polymerase sigma-70 factor, ECF subfamily|nr:sigma-70 family RNA polymerase sigma factor [Halieaceae bacterium]
MQIFDSDKQLTHKALAGSERAWDRLVRRYEKPVYNQALRMTRNPADAMDLLQEIFLAIYRNLPNYRGSGDFGAWVRRIAINRCTDFLRHRQRQPETSEEALYNLAAPSSPDEEAYVGQRNKEILKMLSELSAEQRTVVELKFFQQQTFEEIAQQLGISSNTAKTRLYGAIDKLKRKPEVIHAL